MDNLEQEIAQLKKAFISLQSWVIKQNKSISTRLDNVDEGVAATNERVKPYFRDPKPKRFWRLQDPKGKVHKTGNLRGFFKKYYNNSEKDAHNAYNGLCANKKYKGWILLESHRYKAPKSAIYNNQ